MSEISEKSRELYAVLMEKDYPETLCREIAFHQLTTDYTATRMLGYLYRYSSPRVEDVVDEMIAILSDREALMKKKMSEEANAAITRLYREGLPGEDDE